MLRIFATNVLVMIIRKEIFRVAAVSEKTSDVIIPNIGLVMK